MYIQVKPTGYINFFYFMYKLFLFLNNGTQLLNFNLLKLNQTVLSPWNVFTNVTCRVLFPAWIWNLSFVLDAFYLQIFGKYIVEEKIKKKGNVQLSLALKTIDDVSRSKGLSAEDIISLIGVAASGCHGKKKSCLIELGNWRWVLRMQSDWSH